MTTTACDDQLTVGTQPLEPVHQPYDIVSILHRNIADLEIALRAQTELKERAEAELAKLMQQKPVAHIDYWKSDGTLIARRQETSGGKLYAAPVPAAPYGVDDVEKLRQILSESARPDVPAGRIECPDDWSDEHKQTFSRWVHEEMQNNARRSIIKRARALLQSAEVTNAAADRLLEGGE